MPIQLIDPTTKQALVAREDGLYDPSGACAYPRTNGVFRIAGDDNYTQNFGFQWNKFAETQVDKASQLDMSKRRFFAETNWDREDLSGKTVLEVGSGAGRFSQIILDHTQAELYSVDYSNAVDANFRNNGTHPRLHLFQASIYELPFAPAQFDKVICIGVLQHTPDFEQSVASLCRMVKPGGELVVDFYGISGWWTKLQAKYLFRPITKRMSHEKLHAWIDRNVDGMIRASRFFTKIGVGKFVNRFLPLCDIDGTLPPNLPYAQLRELCVLDTFDMFSPEHDHPQTLRTVGRWCEQYGLVDVKPQLIYYDNCQAFVVKGRGPNLR